MKERIAAGIACLLLVVFIALAWFDSQAHSVNPPPSIPASEFLTSENEVICAPNSTCVNFIGSYLDRLERKALSGDGEFFAHVYPMMLFGNTCRVLFRNSKDNESRRVEFNAPTCEQAAKLVVERLVKP